MNHEGHEAHEGGRERPGMQRSSPLDEVTEELIRRTIGCAIEVHRALGPGFLESIYQKAMCVELSAQKIPFESQLAISVAYRDCLIHGQRVDLLIDRRVIVELKAVRQYDPIHQAQLISYLKTMKLRAGLLINFHAHTVVDGLRRIVF